MFGRPEKQEPKTPLELMQDDFISAGKRTTHAMADLLSKCGDLTDEQRNTIRRAATRYAELHHIWTMLRLTCEAERKRVEGK